MKTNEITLDGKKYLVVPETYNKRRQETTYPRFSTGEPSLTDFSVWQFIQQNDWRGGAGQKDWQEPNKFLDSSGIKPEFQRLQLSTALTCTEPAGGNTTPPGGLLELGYDPAQITSGMWWKGRYWFVYDGAFYMTNPMEKPAHVPGSQIFQISNYSDWVQFNIETVPLRNLVSLYIYEATPIASLSGSAGEYQIDYLNSRIRLSTNIPGVSGRTFTIRYTTRETHTAKVVGSVVDGNGRIAPNVDANGMINLGETNIIPRSLLIRTNWTVYDIEYYYEAYNEPLTVYLSAKTAYKFTGKYKQHLFQLARSLPKRHGYSIGSVLDDENGLLFLESLGPQWTPVSITEEKYINRNMYDEEEDLTTQETYIFNKFIASPSPVSGYLLHEHIDIVFRYNAFTDKSVDEVLHEGEWKTIEATYPILPGSELVTYAPPGAAVNLRDGIDFLADLTMGRIKPFEAGRMATGIDYTAVFAYQDPSIAGSVEKISELDGTVSRMLATDLLYLQIGDHEIWACDGTSLTKMVSQEDLVITSIVYWAGKTFYAGNRSGDGYVYEFLNPHALLKLEGKEIDNLGIGEHLLIKSGNEIFCYTGIGYYRNQDASAITEGWIELSGIAGNTPFINKLFKKIFLKFQGDDIPTLKIRKNLTDNWQKIPLLKSEEQEETYEALLPENYLSPLIYLRLETSSATVRIDQVMVQYLPHVYEKLTWTFTIKAEDNLRLKSGLPEQRSPRFISKDLWAAKKKGIIDMIDSDGEKAKVIIYDISEATINKSNKQETLITPVIIEL